MKTPYFTDKRVRQAMSYAFDYDEMLEHDLPRPVPAGPRHVPPDESGCFPKNGPQPYHQDLDKAEDLLDEAGWTDSDGDGIRDKEINGRRVPFEFTLLTYQTETGIQAATLMKECLGQDRHHLQREADRVHRAARLRAESQVRGGDGRLGRGHRSRYDVEHLRHRRDAQLRQLLESSASTSSSSKAAANSTATSGPRSTARFTTSCGRTSPTRGSSIATRSTGSTRKLRGYNFQPTRARSLFSPASTASSSRRAVAARTRRSCQHRR